MADEGREPLRHPTYGTLAELAARIEDELNNGYFVRPGLIGALSWFVHEYQTAEPANAPEDPTP